MRSRGSLRWRASPASPCAAHRFERTRCRGISSSARIGLKWLKRPFIVQEGPVETKLQRGAQPCWGEGTGDIRFPGVVKRRWPLSVCNSGEYLQLGRRTRAEVRSPGLWAAFRTFLCAWPGLLGSKWGLPGVPLPPGLLSTARGGPPAASRMLRRDLTIRPETKERQRKGSWHEAAFANADTG